MTVAGADGTAQVYGRQNERVTVAGAEWSVTVAGAEWSATVAAPAWSTLGQTFWAVRRQRLQALTFETLPPVTTVIG